jgi:hypothetical protein
MTRPAQLVVGALVVAAAVGVGCAAFGFVSVFTCEPGSNCYFATFFSRPGTAAEVAPSSSPTLTSAGLASTQETPVATATPPAPLASRISAEPTTSTAATPLPRDPGPAEVATRPPAEPREANGSPRADAKTPGSVDSDEDKTPRMSPVDAGVAAAEAASASTPPAATELEPGVMTDPPAGEVPDWEPIPDRSQGPIYVAPVVILPQSPRAPRGH